MISNKHEIKCDITKLKCNINKIKCDIISLMSHFIFTINNSLLFNYKFLNRISYLDVIYTAFK